MYIYINIYIDVLTTIDPPTAHARWSSYITNVMRLILVQTMPKLVVMGETDVTVAYAQKNFKQIV